MKKDAEGAGGEHAADYRSAHDFDERRSRRRKRSERNATEGESEGGHQKNGTEAEARAFRAASASGLPFSNSSWRTQTDEEWRFCGEKPINMTRRLE